MRALQAVFLASVLAAGGLAFAAEAARPAAKETVSGPVTMAELKAEIGNVNRATGSYIDGLKKEAQTTRKTVLVVMLGLAALILFTYAKVGMVEKKLLKANRP